MSEWLDLSQDVIKARRFYRQVIWGKKKVGEFQRHSAKGIWDALALRLVVISQTQTDIGRAFKLSRKGSEAHTLAHKRLYKLV